MAPFDKKALAGFLKEGHRFFVRQSFNRARDPFDEGTRAWLLICHYRDEGPAREHYEALKDPYRFLYDWENEAHRRRLEQAASGPPGYRIYTNTFMPDWERHITKRIQQKIGAWLKAKGWSPDRNDPVQTYFYPHFGEVMIGIKFRRQELRVKFEEIEKIFP